jgi:hypothetical protein
MDKENVYINNGVLSTVKKNEMQENGWNWRSSW